MQYLAFEGGSPLLEQYTNYIALVKTARSELSTKVYVERALTYYCAELRST
jgi:hypothetical protein